MATPAPASGDGDLARALDYPYARPTGAFALDAAAPGVEVTPLRPGELPAWAAGRTPVLAIGSNGAPSQHRRKFAGFDGDARIAVVDVTLRDHDVVFAACVSSYGAVPATIVPSPGTAVSVAVVLVTDAQARRIEATEALGRVYDLVPLDAGLLAHGGRPFGDVVPAATVGCFSARAGVLDVDGAPRALAALPACGRRWPSASERQVLGRLADERGLGVDELVRRMVADSAFRRRVAAGLTRWSGDGPR